MIEDVTLETQKKVYLKEKRKFEKKKISKKETLRGKRSGDFADGSHNSKKLNDWPFGLPSILQAKKSLV